MIIFDTFLSKKIQILILPNMAKNCLKTIFGNKKALKNHFLWFGGEKKKLKKKMSKLLKKAKKT